jgi:HSP20 family molecular chaperone IbpA
MSHDLSSDRPPANIYEANGQLSVVIPVPGAHQEHTGITMTSDHLRVDANCKYSQDSQNYLRHDWKVGRWQLDLDLPKRVDASRARATLNLGVLVVMAPVSDAAAGEHRVAVVDH